ncbi:hypothetical protein [Roseateles toxinivorans]|uniref:Uncharacterized protein n=1 Tax=Roseateles toxinivorans TaxID=270368 RepID=A0A4R6QMN5_9BURK|nr:hypothetical protein [Roseateles toxinivorans]TDP71142.1 hypothetical protein DES47_103120 [Roseateles toxinivorans]
MSVQWMVVALLVPACGLYAAWTLMPAAARRALALLLLRIKPDGVGSAALRKAAMPGSACGCSGCDRAPPKAQAQTLHFHPRAKR